MDEQVEKEKTNEREEVRALRSSTSVTHEGNDLYKAE